MQRPTQGNPLPDGKHPYTGSNTQRNRPEQRKIIRPDYSKRIMHKITTAIAILALACSAYSWDDTFPVYVNITKKHMNVGAEGGHLPDVFYTMQLDRYGSRYISLHKENETDPGRIVWALYSEKNGMLDSAIVDEKGKLYKSVGGGAGGRIPPPLKENLKYSDSENVVVAPLSAFDEIAVDLKSLEGNGCPLCERGKITFVLELDSDRKSFIRRLQSYEPLFQLARKAGFSVIDFALLCSEFSCGDLSLFLEMFESVGLEPPPPPQKRKLFQPSNIDKDIDKVLKEIEKLGTTKVKRKKR